jgi:methyl-accepting chemotaxis protein
MIELASIPGTSSTTISDGIRKINNNGKMIKYITKMIQEINNKINIPYALIN